MIAQSTEVDFAMRSRDLSRQADREEYKLIDVIGSARRATWNTS